MNDENHQPVIDLLDRAMAALRSTAASESPPPRVVVATIEALNSRFGQTETNSSEIRPREIETRQRMFRIARYSTVAAAILLMVVGASLVLFMDRGASPAFGQVIENVEKAKSVVFDCETTLGGLGDAPGHTSRQKYYMQGGLVRAEIRVVRGGNETPVTDIFIGDTDKKELLQIRYAPKTAEKRPLAGAAVEFLKNPVDWFRTLTDKDAELVGNERLNGADALIYNLKRFNFGQSDELKEGESAKVWVDPKTHLPVQLVVEKFFPGAAVRSRAILTDFHWNELLDPKLFEMAVPDGFKVAEGSANPRFTDGQGEDTHRFAAEEIMQLPFSLALKQVREARSMSYTQTATSEGQQRPVITKEFIAEDGRRRSELKVAGASGGVTTIFDTNGFIRLVLTDGMKTALVSPPRGDRGINAGKMFATWLQDLKELGDKPDKELGQKELEGRTATGFVGKRGNISFTIWLDAANGNLVCIEYDSPVGGKDTHISMTDFRFNEVLDESLFSFDVPAGFSVREQPLAPSVPGGEASVVEALRGYTERNAGKFPASLTDWGAWAVQFSKDNKNGTLDKETARVMSNLGAILPFLTSMPKSDYAYLGEGKTVDQKDAIVFWYKKPDGRYRAVYGDLSIKDVSAEDLPKN